MPGYAFRNIADDTVVVVPFATGFDPAVWISLGEVDESLDTSALVLAENGLSLVESPTVAQDRAWRVIRAQRKLLIEASDYVEFSRRMTDDQRVEGLAYRDALFDLPETTDPFAPEWPTPPAWLTLPD